MRASITNLITLSFICYAASGCVATGNSLSSGAAQPLPDRFSMAPLEKRTPKPTEGSIYSEAVKNIYEDSRARHVGDIVMVQIVESSSGSKSASTSTSRESSIEGGISSLFGYESLFTGKDAAHTPSLTSLNTSLEKAFSGTGATNRDSSVTATLSARVIDITADGNLIIRGYREVKVNNETQHIILSGIIRPSDISQSNTIESSYMADARIEYSGTGTLSNKQEPGFASNALDILWPF